MRVAALVALLFASAAGATERWQNGIDGVGRVEVLAGWKLTPNDWFFSRSEANGYPTVSRGIGGPAACLSFGYGATKFIEAAIDLFFGHDRVQIAGFDPINTFTYGALIGVRFTFMDLLFKGLAPYLGFGIGPTLGYVFGHNTDGTIMMDTPPVERLVTGVSPSAGVAFRITDTIGISLEYRFLYARGVWYTSGIDTGGHFLTLGLVIYFARTPSLREGMPSGP